MNLHFDLLIHHGIVRGAIVMRDGELLASPVGQLDLFVECL